MAKVHRLKTWPGPFAAVKHRLKPFEIRRDDRGFAVDDVLVLDEWDPKLGRYTDEPPIARIVTYVLDGGFGLEAGHVAMGLDRFADEGVAEVLIKYGPARKDQQRPGEGTVKP